MAKLTSFTDFVGGDKPIYNNSQPKPYIYVIKYIMGKDIDYSEELKEYILTYKDEESDYEDDNSYDPLMRRLKEFAEDDNYDEIEELVLNYEDFEDDDFDSDDDDYEEKLYKGYNEPVDYIEINDVIEDSTLSDKLKDFLKIDIEFEDLGKESIEAEDDFDEDIEKDFNVGMNEDLEELIEEEWELEEYHDDNTIDIDYEEIVEEALDEEKEEEDLDIKKDKDEREFLDKLPVFIHTKNGKKPTKKQLEDLADFLKEDDKPDDDDVIRIHGEYE